MTELTYEQYCFIGLQEQHAEADGIKAVISESYTATALRYGVPPVFETGKFRPRKGDAIVIRSDKVINKQPWEKYCREYQPQCDHSFLSRAFSQCHTHYCDFLVRKYTNRFNSPSQDVLDKLNLLTQITSVEKIFQEKYAAGLKAFAFPPVYQLLHQCYQLRQAYAGHRWAINVLAKKRGWSEEKREVMYIQARKEHHDEAERLRLSSLPSLPPLPLGTPRIILLPLPVEVRA
jgi:hypothetical protein